MSQTVKCDSCDSKEFANMNRDYYSMRWTFECSKCGNQIVVREAEE